MNCCAVPAAIEEFAGVNAIDTRTTGAVTVSVVEPVILPNIALILEVLAVPLNPFAGIFK